MYEIFEKLLKERGLKIADVARDTGIPYSTFTDWKSARYTPKSDKRQKIADYFGVSLKYLDTGEEDIYYINPETEKIAAYAFHNEDIRLLLHAAKGNPPENIKLAAEMLMRMKQTNNDG